MKVFISWSGQQSKDIAEALRQWLPGVIQAVKPYYSPDDISKGSRWGTEISQELDSSRIGIICLTRDNLAATWIMFEAGALSKNLEKSKVCPILFGVEPSDIEGPLIQFQAAKFSKTEIRKVVKMINHELGDSSLNNEVLDSVFEMWWPKLDESIQAILAQQNKAKTTGLRSDREILDEILILSRQTSLAKDKANKVHPNAIRDLIVFFNEISAESVKTGRKELVQACIKLKKPVKYLLKLVEDSSRRDELDTILETATLSLDLFYDGLSSSDKSPTKTDVDEKK